MNYRYHKICILESKALSKYSVSNFNRNRLLGIYLKTKEVVIKHQTPIVLWQKLDFPDFFVRHFTIQKKMPKKRVITVEDARFDFSEHILYVHPNIESKMGRRKTS